MALWVGRPGALVVLPDPDPGVGVPWSQVVAEHRLLGGGRVVEVIGTGRRSFTLSWSGLPDDEYGLVEEFASGSRGPGPFLLVPADARWNYLSAGQASATSITGDTSGWSVTGGETLTSVSAAQGPVVRGPRSLRWNLAVPTSSGRLSLTAPAGLAGWPAIPGVPWTFTIAGQASPGGGIPLTVAAVLRWLDPAAAEVAVSAGAPVNLAPGGWSTVGTNAVPPVGAWHVLPEVRVEPASVTGATRLYVDMPQLQIGSPVGPWLPGRGVPQVAITAVDVAYGWVDVLDVRATFTEVG